MPEIKLFVPSIGSSTQTYSASDRSEPYSSPMTPWAGNVCPISRRIAASAPRSASVTGSNGPPLDLSSAPIALRKNGRITSPETWARRSTKAAKSTAVMRYPPKRTRKGMRFLHICYPDFGRLRALGGLGKATQDFVLANRKIIQAARLGLTANWARGHLSPTVAYRTKKALASAPVSADIVAVRHELPHMPSLGVSSLD